MGESKTLSRREFLRVATLTAASAAVVACQPKTVVVEKEVTKEVVKEVKVTQVVEVEKEVTKIVAGTPVVQKIVETKVVEVAEVSARQPSEFQELIQAGKLPPLEDRLPIEALVQEPPEAIGTYGGSLRTVGQHPRSTAELNAGGLAGLFKFSPDCTQILPHLAKGFEFSNGAKTLTIYLRKGTKWSNGDPFTVDNILWAWEDMFLNTEITPALSKTWKPGGEPAEMVKVNDYTLQANFAVSAPAIMTKWGHANQMSQIGIFASDYLKTYHIKYNKDAQSLAEKEGYDQWWKALAYHRAVADWASNLEVPRLDIWIPTEQTDNFKKIRHNPYSWQVDSEGNQLPYIDEMTCELVGDLQNVNLQVIAGNVSHAAFDLLMENYSLYKQHEQDGDYRVLEWNSVWGSAITFMPNTTHKDPVLRQIFSDVRFRRALSLAIDREEINDKIFFGLGTPRQVTVLPSCSFYKEEWAKAYAQFDPEQAEKLLDEMGLDKRDAAGFRLRPDGKTLEIIVEYIPVEGPKGAVCELAKEYWEDIGIKIALKSEMRSAMEERLDANEHDIGVWHTDSCTEMFCQIEPLWFYPGSRWCMYVREYVRWFTTDGQAGEEPPQEWKDLVQTFDDWNKTDKTQDPKEWTRLAQKIWDFHSENLYLIGTVGMPVQPAVIKNYLKNVVEENQWGWDNNFWSTQPTPTWYIAE